MPPSESHEIDTPAAPGATNILGPSDDDFWAAISQQQQPPEPIQDELALQALDSQIHTSADSPEPVSGSSQDRATDLQAVQTAEDGKNRVEQVADVTSHMTTDDLTPLAILPQPTPTNDNCDPESNPSQDTQLKSEEVAPHSSSTTSFEQGPKLESATSGGTNARTELSRKDSEVLN